MKNGRDLTLDPIVNDAPFGYGHFFTFFPRRSECFIKDVINGWVVINL